MKTIDIIAGLQILSHYYEKPEGYNCGAGHDVLYAYATHTPLSDDDLNKMIALGWHQEHDEVNYEEDFEPSEYRADESWHAYT